MGKILSYSDRSVQKILREVDTSELSVMLEGSKSDVRKKILRNMSQRAARLLVEEEIRADPNTDGVKRLVGQLFEIVRKLEEAGEIITEE